MKSKDKKLTSVRLHPELFSRFKEEFSNKEMTFQKLAERSLFLYLNEERYRELIDSTKNLKD